MSPTSAGELPAHGLKVALLQPQIEPTLATLAPYAGRPARAAPVRPLGFVISDHSSKRSAMDDASPETTVHDDTDAFMRWSEKAPRVVFDHGHGGPGTRSATATG